ncbi:MAG: iron-sulfur cluster repair di-iron protein [Candidatus Cyclobacteriaceae bacterium M2_1C_046]
MLQGSSKIVSLVSTNHIYASVLYYFGIQFYRYPNHTLEEACKGNGVKVKQVIQNLEAAAKSNKKNELRELINYPINLIVEYLKHSHSVFIKKDLPYISHLIKNLDEKHIGYEQIVIDLKIVFPLFAEDFIHHIYEEEDSLFSYIELLKKAQEQGYLTSRQYMSVEKYSLQHYAVEHSEHDDEMRSVRRITNQYHLPSHAPLHLKVIFSELKAFEEKLRTHAMIENHILFPKALQLEDQILKKYQEVIKLN